jgi:porin
MPIDLITNAVTSLGSLALLVSPQRETTAEISAATNAPAASVASDKLLGDWGGRRTRWSDAGYDFTIQYLGEGTGNVSGGRRRGAVYNGLLNVGAHVDLEKAAGWSGASFHTTMLFPHGRSLTDHYVGDLYRLSNLDATDNVHLFELWLEQNFAGGKYSLRAGQLAVDQEFACTEQGALFGSAAFGWFPIVGAAAPVYPQGAPGARFAWRPSDKIFWQAAVVDGDVNPTAASGRESNPHGLKVKLDEGALILTEAGINWSLAQNTRPGSFKLGGWYHTDKRDDVRLDAAGLSLADPLSTGTPKAHAGNWGIYLAAEQIVWRENPADKNDSQGLGVFSRLGYAPPDRNLLEYYAEFGATRTGWLPHRDDDVCGLAVAFGRMGGDTGDLVRDQNKFNATRAPLPDYELVIEAAYQVKVHPGLAVQPSVQYIAHPGGSAAVADALVLGLRAIIDF